MGCNDETACNYNEMDICDVSCEYAPFGVDCDGNLTLCGEGTIWNDATGQCEIILQGDFDFDMCITLSDLLGFLGNYNNCVDLNDLPGIILEGQDSLLISYCGEGTYWNSISESCEIVLYGDFNLDNCIDLNDLLDLLVDYNTCLED